MVTIRFTACHDDTGAIGKYVIKANDFERSVLKVALAAKGFVLEEHSFLENYEEDIIESLMLRDIFIFGSNRK